MAFRKMNRVGEVDDLAQEIGASAEALDDSWNLLAAGTGSPVVVGGCGIARRGGVFGDFDLGDGFRVVGGRGVLLLAFSADACGVIGDVGFRRKVS